MIRPVAMGVAARAVAPMASAVHQARPIVVPIAAMGAASVAVRSVAAVQISARPVARVAAMPAPPFAVRSAARQVRNAAMVSAATERAMERNFAARLGVRLADRTS